MLTNHDIISFLHTHKSDFERDYGFRRMFLFGSFARGEASVTSDIDIVVEADKAAKTYRNFLSAKAYLAEAFHRPIDLVFMDSMNPIIRETMRKEMIEIE
jgi:uncharacterized protein